MKTKLGVSVGLLGAAIYFSALFGGYIPVILLAGYVLLCEEDQWLKRTAVKAVVLLMTIAFLLALVGLIPDFLGWIRSFVAVFKGEFNYSVVTRIINLINSTITIVRTCLFLLLGTSALKQGNISIPFVDGFVDKYMPGKDA